MLSLIVLELPSYSVHFLQLTLSIQHINGSDKMIINITLENENFYFWCFKYILLWILVDMRFHSLFLNVTHNRAWLLLAQMIQVLFFPHHSQCNINLCSWEACVWKMLFSFYSMTVIHIATLTGFMPLSPIHQKDILYICPCSYLL